MKIVSHFMFTCLPILSMLILQHHMASVHADSNCGAGYITVKHDTAIACVACGDEFKLQRSSNFSQACLTNVGSTYCALADSVGTCNSCPAGTVASAWDAASTAQCQCAGTTQGPAGGPCAACPDGSICENGASATCPAGSVCIAGVVTPCPLGSSSAAGSDSITDCTTCSSGFFSNAGGCAVCPAGSFCSGGVVTGTCPAGSTSDAMSVSASDCRCLSGYHGSPTTGSPCVPCEDGHYCANNVQTACTTATTGAACLAANSRVQGCVDLATADVSATCCASGNISLGSECVVPLAVTSTWTSSTQQVGTGSGGYITRTALAAGDTYHFVRGASVFKAGSNLAFAALSPTHNNANGPALSTAAGITSDHLGNVYITDSTNALIYKLSADGTTIQVVAGTSGTTGCVDNADPLQATFTTPAGIVWRKGKLYITDTTCNYIRAFDVSAGVTTLTLTGAAASLSSPTGIAITEDGARILVADAGNSRVKSVVVATGAVAVLGGGAALPFAPASVSIAPDNVRVLITSHTLVGGWYTLGAQNDIVATPVTLSSTFTAGLSSIVSDSKGTRIVGVSVTSNDVFNVQLSCATGFPTLLQCVACDYGSSVADCPVGEYEGICANGQSMSDRPCIECPPLATTPTGESADAFADCKCGASRYMSSASTCEPMTCGAGNFNDLSTAACTTCQANFYCPALKGAIACPVYSTNTNTGSVSVADCVCNNNYIRHVLTNGETACVPDCTDSQFYNTVTGTCNTCPIGSWCDGIESFPCGTHATSLAGASSFSQCFCEPSFFGPEGGSCDLCPAGSTSLSGALLVSDCVCSAGTFGTVSLLGVVDCTICPVGSYCPGDGTKQLCPSSRLTVPRTGASTLSHCKAPVCGNGILELGEECDDGPFSGYGCSGFCQFEDACNCASGAQFVCNTNLFSPSGCCRSYRNPITLANVCTCDGQAADFIGYKINDDCSIQDINECDTNHGGCSPNAVCINYDGTLKVKTHECKCPPGMIGDGITRCEIFIYETQIDLEIVGITHTDVNVTALVNAIVSQNTIFVNKSTADIKIEVMNYVDGALSRPSSELGAPVFQQRRMLLQNTANPDPNAEDSGVNIKVIVSSESALEMEATTAATDKLGLTVFLEDWYQTAVRVLQGPFSAIQTLDSVYGTVTTVLTGFDVEDIVYNMSSLEWLITVHYVANSPNTLTSLYVTKSNTPPYSQATKDSFYISKHPCMETSSVCCLADYASDYYIGDFAQNITSRIGVCDSSTRAADTLGMFNTNIEANSDILMHALDDLPHSYVTRLDSDSLQLHINRLALQDRVSMRTPFAGGYIMDFFVGMSYYTLLPTNAIATVASQTKVQARFTDALVFATASEQDYTFIDYITLALFQTKYVPDLLTEYKMQYVKVGFVLPETVRQNMDTGLVPLTSIRFAVAKALPSATDDSKWTNPCFSSDNTGLFDNSTSSLRSLYVLSSHQTCSLQPSFCQNPIMEVLDTGLVEFYFPIGEETISASELGTGPDTYSLFVYFDVAVVTGAGRGVRSVTKLFAQAPLNSVSITKQCESLSIARSMNDVVEVDMDIGMVGLDADWDQSVTRFTNLLSSTQSADYTDTALSIKATSMQSGLITIAVRGSDAMFTSPVAQPFHVEIEDMLSMHFLESTKYNAMLSLLSSNQAWELVRHEDTGYLEIALTRAAVNLCSTEAMPGDFTCAARRSIFRRQVVLQAAHSVHPLATGVNTNNEQQTVNWLQEHILGRSEFNQNFARNFTRIVRQKHKINDRYNKAWFINPMYKWTASALAPAQSILSLSDKTILLAVVVLEDEGYAYGSGGGGAGRRRMLLQVADDGTGNVQQIVQKVKDHPTKQSMPPLVNNAVNPDREIARMVGVESKPWVKTSLGVVFNADATMTPTQVRDEIERRFNTNKAKFTTELGKLHITQFLMQPDEDYSTQRRLLAPGDVVKWTGTVNMLWSGAPEHADCDPANSREVYMNWLHCALWLADLNTDRLDQGMPDCTQHTTAAMTGFVTSFWADTCNNYSFSVSNCTEVLRVLADNGTIVVPNRTVGEAYVLGFKLYINIMDRMINADTMTQSTKQELHSIVADYFGAKMDQVVLETASSSPITHARRLLNVYSLWKIYVHKNYDLSLIDVPKSETEITHKIYKRLALNVSLDIVKVDPNAPAPTPKAGPKDTPKPAKKDSEPKNSLIAIIILSCICGVLLVAMIVVGCMYYMTKEHAKTSGADSPSAETTNTGDGNGTGAMARMGSRFDYQRLSAQAPDLRYYPRR